MYTPLVKNTYFFLQVPKKRQLTKWEEYAKIKGITNKKKSRMVYDEQTKVIPMVSSMDRAL